VREPLDPAADVCYACFGFVLLRDDGVGQKALRQHERSASLTSTRSCTRDMVPSPQSDGAGRSRGAGGSASSASQPTEAPDPRGGAALPGRPRPPDMQADGGQFCAPGVRRCEHPAAAESLGWKGARPRWPPARWKGGRASPPKGHHGRLGPRSKGRGPAGRHGWCGTGRPNDHPPPPPPPREAAVLSRWPPGAVHRVEDAPRRGPGG